MLLDFGNISSPSIIRTRDELLQYVDQQLIYKEYFGSFEIGKVYPSIFRKDRSPSAGFYVGKNGIIYYHDFATQERLDCVAFVAKLYHMSYKDALARLSTEFIKDPGKVSQIRKKFTPLASESFVKKQKTSIQIIPGKWTEERLAYWNIGNLNLSPEYLASEGIIPVDTLYIKKRKIESIPQLTFAYHIKHAGEEYLKIYCPFDERIKHLNNIPLSIPFGLQTLKPVCNKLIITKSKKDEIVLKQLFPCVISLQNESPSAFNPKIISHLKENFTHIYLWFDNDNTGLEVLSEMEQQGFISVSLPINTGCKDPYDYVEKYGISEFKIIASSLIKF